ncbi:putative SAM-dependent methyltransferase [Laceyella sediminis]|uniref:SAM-dependent methyltransferase n=1 Tax=Laceyella sediminis TaxID=573074 RepID=A0ABX5EQA8_9BACL|nr:class I SAM-dependent methyltransferase [Laceyella sediminis]PRZ15457.1 putative SAM-dependent methyltransferase [Laceyella sediminis]
MFVTTSFHPGTKEIQEARYLSALLGIPYVKRERHSLPGLFAQTGESRAVIVTKQGWRVEEEQGQPFFFHPSMSALRIKQLLNGDPDAMVECAGLKPGDRVLDCTLGMGADAVVAAHVVGDEGQVVALESQPVIAAIVKHGLKTYETDRKALHRALRRVEVVQADYRNYLPLCQDNSFDVVMFDPMFRETVQASNAIQQLKPLANPEPLDERSVREAIRVAKRAVLLKERPKGGEFARLGFEIVKSSSSFAWGVIRKGGVQ